MLTKGEIIIIIEDYIGVESGYLGDFSYSRLQKFYPKYCDIEINTEEIEETSIRRKFQNILANSNAENQIKIIRGIFNKYPIESFPDNEQLKKKKLFENYQEIIKRL